MRPCDSSANVENVVKPPQKPVFRSSSARGVSDPLRIRPVRTPMMKEPMMLMARVFQGNPPWVPTGRSPMR